MVEFFVLELEFFVELRSSHRYVQVLGGRVVVYLVEHAHLICQCILYCIHIIPVSSARSDTVYTSLIPSLLSIQI